MRNRDCIQKLGVVGGLGPLASVRFIELLRRKENVERDQDYIPLVISSIPYTPDRTAYLLNQEMPNPYPCIRDACFELKQMGASSIVIPCVTAHYFEKEIVSEVGIPILSMPRLVSERLKKDNINKVGLLATTGTINTVFFQSLLANDGIGVVLPSEIEQSIVMHVIYDEIKVQKKANIEAIREVAKNLLIEGAEVILLGCTELSLISDDLCKDGVYLDVLDVLAEECVKKYSDNRLKKKEKKVVKNITEWLESNADCCPMKVAVSDEEREMTWIQVRNQAKQIGFLLSKKTGAKKPIVLLMEKSVEAYVTMLGVVYAGCFYSFINIYQPSIRVKKTVEVLNAGIIIADKKNYELAYEVANNNVNRKVILFDDFINEEVDYDEASKKVDSIIESTTAMDPLYVTFTSGSTGIPKGVCASHQNIISFIESFVETFELKETDIFGNQAPLDFDMSVKDLYSGLRTGAHVCLIPRVLFSRPAELMDYIEDKKITNLVWAVGAMCIAAQMHALDYKIPASVKKILFSGEAMPIKYYNQWRSAYPDTLFVNLYGPTETTCNCSYYILENRLYGGGEEIPIGKAFSDEEIILIAEDGSVIPPEKKGIQGEIYVRGASITLGYYGNEKTSEVYVQNPTHSLYRDIVYRTGDMGSYSEDGELFFHGRKDTQIKRMGHRIELSEIESIANSIEGVDRACCVFQNSISKIILFYIGREDINLGKELREKLPLYMVPSKTKRIESFPMTSSGKIDRKKLEGMLK